MVKFNKSAQLLLGVILAFALWSITFLTDLTGSFWIRVSFSSIILAVYASKVDQEKLFQELTGFNIFDFSKGAIGGMILYLFFYLGYSSMRSFLLEGASKVYLFRAESPITIIALSLIITSFCEEFFWRAYIQRNLVLHYELKNGILITSIAYALIHAPTMNTPLMFAALIAGLFWGILYAKTQNIWLVIASHLFWTELIFVFLPLK